MLGRTVVEIAPRLKGEHPRGWPVDATFENVPAVFLPSEKMIAIGEYARQGERLVARSPERVAASMRHVFGHSVDAALRVSESSEFTVAYQQDVAVLSASERMELDYFLQPGVAGRHETFAQLLAQALGEAPIGIDVSAAFPNAWRVVRSLVEGSLK